MVVTRQRQGRLKEANCPGIVSSAMFYNRIKRKRNISQQSNNLCFGILCKYSFFTSHPQSALILHATFGRQFMYRDKEKRMNERATERERENVYLHHKYVTRYLDKIWVWIWMSLITLATDGWPPFMIYICVVYICVIRWIYVPSDQIHTIVEGCEWCRRGWHIRSDNGSGEL